MEFADKVVLVTGSTSGIGEETVRQFSRAGATVIVNSSTSVAAGEALAGSLDAASYVQGDISNEQDASRLIATVLERHGRLDVLVNNAGVTEVIPHADLQRADVQVWRHIFDVK